MFAWPYHLVDLFTSHFIEKVTNMFELLPHAKLCFLSVFLAVFLCSSKMYVHY